MVPEACWYYRKRRSSRFVMDVLIHRRPSPPAPPPPGQTTTITMPQIPAGSPLHGAGLAGVGVMTTVQCPHSSYRTHCTQLGRGNSIGVPLLSPATRKNRLSVVHDEHAARGLEIMGAGHSMLDSGGDIPPPKRSLGTDGIRSFISFS
jgi:hypothetical protein